MGNSGINDSGMHLKKLFILLFLLSCLPLAGMSQSRQLADSLFQTGKEYDRSGKMKESEFYYREAYQLYRSLEDTASWLEAGKEYASAMVYRSKVDSAMEMYEMLVEVDHPANDDYNRGDIYNSMGWANSRSGRLDKALHYYRKSLPLSEASGDSLLIGVLYDNLGTVYGKKGNYSKALDYSQKALPYFRGLGYQRSISTTLSNIGDIYLELSLYDRALNYYERSLEIKQELGSIHLLAVSYLDMGHAQKELGNYDQALISYQEALDLSRKAGTPNLTSQLLNNIGVLYKSLGELEKALDYYRQSLDLKEKNSFSSQNTATTIRNIGKLLWEMGELEQAEQHYKKALAIRRQIGNPYQIALSLNNMAQLALEKQNYEEARRRAREIQAIGDSTSSYKVLQDASRFYGLIHRAQGNHQEALKQFRREYAYSQFLSPVDRVGPLQQLAIQHHKMNSDSAIVYGKKAIALIEKHRSKAGATSELKTGYFGRHSDFYTQVASWLLTYRNDREEAYKLVEQAKARSLSDELSQAARNIDRQLPEEVRIERNRKRSRIDSLYTRLENATSPQKRETIESNIHQAELDYAAYENNLRNRFPELKSLTSPEPITLEHARSLVDEETAVLEYAIADDRLITFLISRNGIRAEQFTHSGEGSLDEQLTSWVGNFKSAILSNARRSQLQSQSSVLYDALIKPFEGELANFSNILVVPDGALAYLPFEAIYRDGQYLIERFNVKYVPSLTSFTLLKDKREEEQYDLLAVAGSSFSDERPGSTFRKSNLSALPSTLIEVDSISTQFERVSTLKSEEVSERKFKQMLEQNRYRYIHLATHGIIDENHPNRSGLALSTQETLTPSSREDGMLRSSEIFGLNIDSDMVVLSACNTGLGKVVEGEGILGLQRSFFYAGASTVVVSLWNVYDRSTASFMNEFYKALNSAGRQQDWSDRLLRWIGWEQSIPFGNKAAAMRHAKLQMIKHPLFNHPVYWAPFIVVGR